MNNLKKKTGENKYNYVKNQMFKKSRVGVKCEKDSFGKKWMENKWIGWKWMIHIKNQMWKWVMWTEITSEKKWIFFFFLKVQINKMM